ncbi:glycosyltransferase family 25 protein [Acetobacter thailandicus]|uniref:glycosyltransferase family 25 protein n=1 Tax=Acetobacter thailandicus TaxID=1502842 RepID=UPI001BAB0F38|nr:glycosyltransferase family 25 protein [Acetobacter thailandicus]MBS0986970.1 glycosyltransferase family 25 protein [Acetobacter thailandicus]
MRQISSAAVQAEKIYTATKSICWYNKTALLNKFYLLQNIILINNKKLFEIKKDVKNYKTYAGRAEINMKNFVINVKENRKRLETFISSNRNDQNPIEVFEAVTPSKIEQNSSYYAGVLNEGCEYAPIPLSIALSHLHLWNKCIELDENVTIMEDDLVLNHNFFDLRDKHINTLKNFDLLVLGFNTDWPVEIDFGGGIPKTSLIFSDDVSDRNLTDEQFCFPRLNACAGTCCYVLTPQGARKLRETVFPLTKGAYLLRNANSFWERDFHYVAWNNLGIDIAMTLALSKLEARICLPPISSPKNDWGDSSMQRSQHAAC